MSIHVRIDLPDRLAMSLLHIGVQLPVLLVTNPGPASTAATELDVRIVELSVQPTTIAVPALSAGESVELKATLNPTQLDRMKLVAMLNQHDGLPCSVEVRLGDRLLAERHVKVLPPDAWLYGQHPEALAAFVDIKSEAVQRIKTAARPYLRRHLGVSSFIEAIDKALSELRVTDEFTRMKRIVAAIYECLLQSHRVHYEAEPRTYPEDWQKIRFHDQVLSEKQGTCIDLVLLMAACLEDAFLNPVLILFKTGPLKMHMILGCWQAGSKATSPVITDYNQLNRWVRSAGAGGGPMLLWDATGFSVEKEWTFSFACDDGVSGFHRAGALNFVCAVDIAQLRTARIWPLSFSPGPAWTDAGWGVVRDAELIAARYEFDIVERTHLLLALLNGAGSLATDLFGSEACERMRKVADTELVASSPHKTDVRLLQWTRSARASLDRAGRLAQDHGAGLIGPVQLWHALIEAPVKKAAKVLDASDRNTGEVKQTLIDLAAADRQWDSYPNHSPGQNPFPG